jgi:hypothetical protein
MVLSPAVLAPAITYGTGGSLYTATSDSTGSITTNYRVERWQPNATSNTSVGWTTGTTASTVIETDYIEYQTLDMTGTWTAVPTGGYTVRLYRDNGFAAATTGIWYGSVQPPKSAAERLREILDRRMAPSVLSSCKPLGYTQDVREVRARETLRRVLGEDRFRDFVRRGSVSVRAKSGLVYQIFPGSDFTKVYDNGNLIERLCVVLLGGFPPTDSLIMRYLMILNNEQQFRGYAIKHGIPGPYSLPAPQPDQRSLAEIFKELKKVA